MSAKRQASNVKACADLPNKEQMTYEEWEEGIEDDTKQDSLWKMTAYRLALFASDIGWQDTTKLAGDRRTRSLSDQLC